MSVVAVVLAAGASTRFGSPKQRVMLEPVLGESGVVPMRDETLRRIREICDARDLLLILDEVQSGMGRTGRMWAHQHAGITPDVMTVAKGLGGGVPIGAVLANPRADVLEPGDHGCTFGGNPLATSAAIAVLQAVGDDRLVENAAQVGARMAAALEALSREGIGVAGVRGRGLMLALHRAGGSPVWGKDGRAHAGRDRPPHERASRLPSASRSSDYRGR